MNNNLLNMNTNVEDDFFDMNSSKNNDQSPHFALETKINDDDFFQEFNKPSLENRKNKKESNFKKINTKMPPDLHRLLKIYCGQNDYKKNEVFAKSLIMYMESNPTNQGIDIIGKVKNKKVGIDLDSNDKKPYNFEIPIELFKNFKVYSSMIDIKLITLYEQAVINYLNNQ